MVQLDESLDDVMPTETAAPRRPSRRVMPPFNAWRLALALPVLALLPLTVLKAPWIPLFKVQLALTEYGQWLAPLFLAIGVWPWKRASDRATGLLCLALAGLLLVPSLRAWQQAPTLAQQSLAAWGENATAGASERPFTWRGLWTLGSNAKGIQRSEELYDPERGLALSLWQSLDGAGLLTKRPVVLVVHGGGWDQGQRDEFPALNVAMAHMGWVVADVDYRLAPGFPWPAQKDDLMRALEHLRLNSKRLGVDPSHVVLLGRSAGAHLALSFAYLTEDPAIRGVIAFYGPSDLRFAWEHGRSGDILDTPRLLRQLTGGTPASHGAVYDEASPLQHVDTHTPPTLLLHGGIDNLVWDRHSASLDAALSAAKVPHQYVSLPWATHGFDYGLHGPGGQAALYAVDCFLQAAEGLRQ